MLGVWNRVKLAAGVEVKLTLALYVEPPPKTPDQEPND